MTKKITKTICCFAVIICMLTPSVLGLRSTELTEKLLEDAKALSAELNKIDKSNDEIPPIGMNLENGKVKDILSPFNTGLYMMSKIERLPVGEKEDDEGVALPILLYHHITTGQGYGDSVMSIELFREHLDTIKEAGYNTVSLKEIIDYVYYGEDLPEKPILITFDDGYRSNYTLAYPELVKRDMKAVIFVIGWAVGEQMYKDSGSKMIRHFSYAEAREMIRSGYIEIQSHTYDMHQSTSLEEGENVRESVLQFKDESTEDYINALMRDYLKFDISLFSNTGFRAYSLAYPHGEYSEESEEVFKRMGAFITFSTDFSGKNIIKIGNTETLRALCRFTISEGISADALIPMIDRVYNK